MQRYNKLWTAIVGVIAIILGPDFVDLDETVAESILGLLTAAAVYAIPNREEA